ncbi:MAG: ABC transporter permease [Acidobacteriota bacterium]
MIRHLLKLVWNRKRSNALLLLEIFCSFLVVFGVATSALFVWSNYRRPLGFEWKDVWSVSIDTKVVGDDAWTPQQNELIERLIAEARSVPGVVGAAGIDNTPFGFETNNAGWTSDGKRLRSEAVDATLEVPTVLGLQVAAGRLFEPADNAAPWRAVVINRALARARFGADDPLGKRLRERDPSEPEERVVGVVDEFRRGGELALPGNLFLRLTRPGQPSDRSGRRILVRVEPGATVAIEERLVRRLQAVAPDWSFEVQPLSRLRASAFRLWITPVAVGAIVAFFLLSMVALGLLGVLWQNLLRRTGEMGLRRATGASALDVQRQVLLEQALLTTLGVLLGLALVLQLPLFGWIGWIGKPVFAGGVLLAIVALYALTLLCSFYPSLMARRMEPAEALRYE